MCQGGWALVALWQTGLTPTPTAEGHSQKMPARSAVR